MTTVPWGTWCEEHEEGPAGKAAAIRDPPRLLRHGDFEDRLCDVHANDGMLSHMVLLFLSKPILAHRGLARRKEESIASMQLTVSALRGGVRAPAPPPYPVG